MSVLCPAMTLVKEGIQQQFREMPALLILASLSLPLTDARDLSGWIPSYSLKQST
jgi:hypothetical protein